MIIHKIRSQEIEDGDIFFFLIFIRAVYIADTLKISRFRFIYIDN